MTRPLLVLATVALAGCSFVAVGLALMAVTNTPVHRHHESQVDGSQAPVLPQPDAAGRTQDQPPRSVPGSDNPAKPEAGIGSRATKTADADTRKGTITKDGPVKIPSKNAEAAKDENAARLARAASLNAFAIDLHRRAASARPAVNGVVSPIGLAKILALLLAGADGKTADELASVLHLSNLRDWQPESLATGLTLQAQESDPFRLSSVSSLWVRTKVKLRDDYVEFARGRLNAEVNQIDFGAKKDGPTDLINGWVKKETKGLIDNVFTSQSLPDDTRMVAVNATAFEAKWCADLSGQRDLPRRFPSPGRRTGHGADDARMRKKSHSSSATGSASLSWPTWAGRYQCCWSSPSSPATSATWRST